METVIDQEKATVEATKAAHLQIREARLRELGLEIDLLAAKAAEAKADAKIEYAKTLRRLRAKQDVVATRLEELTKASEEAWEELRAGVNGAMKDLERAVDKALSSFE